MSATREPQTIIAAWLEEGPVDLPGDTRRAIVVGARITTQHRSRYPWLRHHPLPALRANALRVGLAVGAVALATLVGFAIWVGQPSGLVGQSPSPPPPASLAGPAPAGTPQPGGIAYQTSGRNSHLTMVDPTTGQARALTPPLTELLASSGCERAPDAGVPRGSDFPFPPEGGFVEDLVWSPDGRALTFQLAAGLGVNDPSNVRCGLYVVSSDGTTLQRLLAPSEPDGRSPFFYSPAWSPDGSQLAVALERSISLVPLDGSALNHLGLPCEGCGPSHWSSIAGWSPDGSQVAAQFHGSGPVDTATIAVANVATAEWTVLWSGTLEPAAGGETGFELLGWLLDGRVVAKSNRGFFAVDTERPDEWSRLPFGPLGLWSPDQTRDALAWTDGLRVRDLLTGEITRIADWEHGEVVAWSPDGAQLAVGRNGGREIWLIGADGSGPRRLLPDPRVARVAWQPVWSSDEVER